MHHVGDPNWNEVFLLVAGMLDDATEFGELYLRAAYREIEEEPPLVTLIQWAEYKRSELSIEHYRPAVVRGLLQSRSIYLFRAYFMARAHRKFLSRYIELPDDRLRQEAYRQDHLYQVGSFAIDRDRDLRLFTEFFRFIDYDLFRDFSLARDIDLDIDQDLYRDFDLIRDHDLARTLRRFRYRNIFNYILNVYYVSSTFPLTLNRARETARAYGIAGMMVDLSILDVPDDPVEPDELKSFMASLIEVLERYQEKWNPIMMLNVAVEEAGSIWFGTDKEQRDLYRDYIALQIMLARCLASAHVPNREALLDKFLLPPEMWQE